MVSAECRLKDIQDPFAGKVKKQKKCPAGIDCVVLDPNSCPRDAETCFMSTDNIRYAYYKYRILNEAPKYYEAISEVDCANTCEFLKRTKRYNCYSAVYKPNARACWLSSSKWHPTNPPLRAKKDYNFYNSIMRLP